MSGVAGIARRPFGHPYCDPYNVGGLSGLYGHCGHVYAGQRSVRTLRTKVQITQIYEGTNQIQRVVIARNLLR